jgi:hypothetical protein
MSWLFSQALVEEYSVDICSDGEQCAPSNGNPTQLAYLSQDKMKKFSRLSRFGMTFRPLTADRGEALLTSYLAAFHAKTSQPQAEEPELTEQKAECGTIWPASLAKYCHVTSSWKIVQRSVLEGSEESSVTWPRSGMMRSGQCWEQPMLALRTKGTGCGLWHTPTCHNAIEGAYPAEYKRKTPTLASQVGGKLNPTWIEWLMGWPLGWTDLKPLEMDKFRQWQRQHSNSYQTDLPDGSYYGTNVY